MSMSDIAKEVNIKTPSLYSHFASKEEIVLTAIQNEIQKYYDFLDSMYASFELKDLKSDMSYIFYAILGYFKAQEKLRFWRNILLIDQVELRRKCNALVFELEIYHVKKIQSILECNTEIHHIKSEDCEGTVLHFISVLQGALEVELLFDGTDQEPSLYIDKLWKSFCTNNLN